MRSILAGDTICIIITLCFDSLVLHRQLKIVNSDSHILSAIVTQILIYQLKFLNCSRWSCSLWPHDQSEPALSHHHLTW